MRFQLAALLLLLLVAVAPQPWDSRVYADDCVKCDIFEDCDTGLTPDYNGCYCTIRYKQGFQICREHGICGFCTPPPLPQIQPTDPIDQSVLDALYLQEPLLALVLLGAASADSPQEGPYMLDIEDYASGTLTSPEGRHYHHQGSFTMLYSGGVHFRFVIRDVERGDTVLYAGVLEDAGRRVKYDRRTQVEGQSSRQSLEFNYTR